MKKNSVALTFLLICLLHSIKGQTESNEQLRGLNNKSIYESLSFTENSGQIHDQYDRSRTDVLFGGQNKGLAFHLRSNGISYQLYRVDEWKNVTSTYNIKQKSARVQQIPKTCTIYRVDVDWLNTNKNQEVVPQSEVGGSSCFYTSHGEFHAKSYSNVTYNNIYNGINLKWYEKDGELKYDYLCEAGSDYKLIQMAISGADRIEINTSGELQITTSLGSIIEKAPLVTQSGKILNSRWNLKGNVLSFEIEGLKKSLPYIIDPAIRAWGTYYGGNAFEGANACATDASGNVYMTGNTYLNTSTIIATSGSHQSTLGGMDDAYLVKFNSSGVRQWATYYGGADSDNGVSLAVDALSGDVYMCGVTSSTAGIATVASHQALAGGGASSDAFLVKFNSSGVRQWATYYGGNTNDQSHHCAVDASGNIYMSGTTELSVTASSTVIATAGSHQGSFGGGVTDGFLVKFNSSGVRQWATFYGGSDIDQGNACTTYSNEVYLSGSTSSTNAAISTLSSHQTANGGGIFDAYLVKFNSSGVRQWATFYGGAGDDLGYSCATDALGNVFMVGPTTTSASGVIATAASHQSVGVTAFDNDGFLVKFNSNGVRQWGTYYGGDDFDDGYGCATDAQNNVYLVGSTSSTLSSAISTSGGYQTTFGPNFGTNAYIVQFNNNGVRQSGTYYGEGGETGYGCAIDASGNAYMVGITSSTTTGLIASSGAHQTSYGGIQDGFLVKFVGCNVGAPTNSTPSSNQTICSGNSATLSATNGTNAINWYASLTSTTVLGTGTTYITPPLSSGSYTYYSEATGCATSPRTPITVTVISTPVITVNSATICSGSSVIITPTATGISSFTITGNTFTVSPATTTSYSITGSNSSCAASNTAVATVSVMTTPTITVNSATICSGNSVVITPTAAGVSVFNITGGNFTVSPSTTTSYSVTGTGTNGCAASNTAVAQVSVNTTPTISVNSATICSGNSVAITPTAVGITVFAITGNNFTVSPVSNTSYSVTGTGTNGCAASNTAVASVVVNISPTLSVNSESICSGTSAVISPSGAVTYSITGGTFTVSPSITTSYSITGTAANGCTSQNTAISTVSVNLSPTITVNSGSICAGQTFTINPSGSSTYTIQGGSAIVSPTVNSSYTVSGTSANGCMAVNAATANVILVAPPTISVNSGTICQGQSFTITPSGANSYTFEGGSAVVSPSANTSYTVIGASASGCLSQNTATVNLVVNFTPDFTVSNVILCKDIGGVQPSAVIQPVGNVTTYTFLGPIVDFVGPNIGASVIVKPLSTTVYTAVAANGNCQTEKTFTVNVGEKSPFVELGTSGSKDINSCGANNILLVSDPLGTQFIVTAANYTSTSLYVSPTVSTTYSVVVSDDGFCYSDPLKVNVHVSFPRSYSSFPDTITNLHWPGIDTRKWDSLKLRFRYPNSAFEFTSAELQCGYQNLYFNSVIPAGNRLRAEPFAPPSSALYYDLTDIGFEKAFVETYTVICDTREGCQVTKELTFKFEAHPFYAAPIQNLITPNNDGDNDIWIPSIDFAYWEIYNSSGMEVASSRGSLKNWNGGVYNKADRRVQKDAPEGVYTYIIFPPYNSGFSKVRTGTITLTR